VRSITIQEHYNAHTTNNIHPLMILSVGDISFTQGGKSSD
jgi:hypothetical protein